MHQFPLSPARDVSAYPHPCQRFLSFGFSEGAILIWVKWNFKVLWISIFLMAKKVELFLKNIYWTFVLFSFKNCWFQSPFVWLAALLLLVFFFLFYLCLIFLSLPFFFKKKYYCAYSFINSFTSFVPVYCVWRHTSLCVVVEVRRQPEVLDSVFLQCGSQRLNLENQVW